MSTTIMRLLGAAAHGSQVLDDDDQGLLPGNLATNGVDLNFSTSSGHRILFGTDLRIAAPYTLDCVSGGFINLPLFGSGNNFKIGGAAVSDNVSAANLGTLTGGGDASALHTHSGGSSITATLPSSPLQGEILYQSGTATLARAKADAAATARACGTYDGASGKWRGGWGDVRTVKFEGSLTLIDGQAIWLSTATAGTATNVDPTAGGSTTVTRLFLGTIWDKTGYTGTGVLVAQVLWMPGEPEFGSA